LKLAKQQGALFWELRNALSLARLWVRQDRNTDARQILEPAYGAFTEGFQIADVRGAKTLLDRLDAD
jgi:predicted ATPase